MTEPNLIGGLCALAAGGFVLLALFDAWMQLRAIAKAAKAIAAKLAEGDRK